jgi:hypothetical protein
MNTLDTLDTSGERRLWDDYASCWSAEPDQRLGALAAVVVQEVAYRDPGTEVSGLDELAAYMTGFVGMFPGHRFRIDEVLAHHDRSLARWTQLDAGGQPVSKGMSAARHHGDRLADVTGYFLPA